MNINSIKPWMQHNQGAITALAVGAPLAVEAGIMVNHILKNPRFLSEKLTELKAQIVSTNVFMLIAFLALSGAVFYGTVCFLPLAAAIPLALSIIFYLGKAIVHPPELSVETAIKAALAVAGIALGGYVVYPILTEGFRWSVSLPFQTKPIVFLEYAVVGLIHLGLGVYHSIKGDKEKAAFHYVTAAVSIIFPIYYWNNEMRLHHSFLGLILMALPFRTMKWIGSVITLDSSMYMLMKNRHDFDFMNILWGNLPLFVGTESAAILAEGINDSYGEGVKMVTLPEAKS